MVDASRFIRHSLIGLSSGVLLMLLTWLFVDGLYVDVIIGSSLAVILTGFYHYSLQYHWTFASDTPHQVALTRYVVMCLGIFVINGLVMYFGVKALHVHYLVVQFIANGTITAWSFFLSSIWVFVRQG